MATDKGIVSPKKRIDDIAKSSYDISVIIANNEKCKNRNYWLW